MIEWKDEEPVSVIHRSVMHRIREHRRALQKGHADLSMAAVHLTRKEAKQLFYEVRDSTFGSVMDPFRHSEELHKAAISGREAEFIHEQMNRCFGFPIFVDLESK